MDEYEGPTDLVNCIERTLSYIRVQPDNAQHYKELHSCARRAMRETNIRSKRLTTFSGIPSRYSRGILDYRYDVVRINALNVIVSFSITDLETLGEEHEIIGIGNVAFTYQFKKKEGEIYVPVMSRSILGSHVFPE